MRIGLAHPEMALLVAAAAALVGLALAAHVRRRRALAAFGGPGAPLTSASPVRQLTKLGLLAIACLSLVAAFAGPQIGEARRATSAATVDTVIVLDVSQSMAVRDVEPDRLHAAQRAIEDLGRQLTGARVGLVIFAGSSVLRYPLSADTKVLGPALDSSGSGFRLTPGTSLKAGLQGAIGAFASDRAAPDRPKAVVVISDGEDLAPDLPALEPLRQRNITVFALGVGTAEGGPIPVYDKGRLVQMLVNANGTQITSRLDEPRLEALAREGGGRYWRYDGEASVRALAEALRSINAGAAARAAGGVSPEDRYQIFLAIAIAALLAEWLVDERREMPRPRMPRVRVSPRRRILGLIGAAAMALAACGASDPIADRVDAANSTFERDPAAALARYRELLAIQPASSELAINAGNALSRMGEYDRALAEYGRALNNAKGATRAIAFYDRGNALFRLARLDEARASYVETLRLDPSDRDAKFNIEVIDRIIATLGRRPQPNATPTGQPGQRPQPGSPPPTGPSGATGPTGPGQPNASASPAPGGNASGSPPPSVQNALQAFRKDLTSDEALLLLDALRREQRGIDGLLDVTGGRRGGNIDTPY